MTPTEMYIEAMEAACGFLGDHQVDLNTAISVVPAFDYRRGEISTVIAELMLSTGEARRVLQGDEPLVKVHNGTNRTMVYARVTDELVVVFSVDRRFATTPATVADVLPKEAA